MKTLVAVALVIACAATASADPLYQHLRLIAPAAPGGGWDQTARAMQQALQAAGIVGTSSVENIPGAAGTIGLARFVSAERGSDDVIMVSGLIMLGGVVTHKSPVTLHDVTPIARLTGEWEVIAVPTSSPYRTMDELMAAFKKQPEAISWGGGSAGGTEQILTGLIADKVGVNPRRVNYIAFSGGGESMSAILGGQVSVGINGLAEFLPHIESGTVRVLAVSSPERLPDVEAPTLREAGIDVVLENWRSLMAPPGLADRDRRRLAAAVDVLVHSQPWRDMLARFRWNDRYLPGQPFARFLDDEEGRVRSVLSQLGIGSGAPGAPAEAPLGRYPIFVLMGLVVTSAGFVVNAVRHRAPAAAVVDQAASGVPTGALQWIVVAVLLHALLLERAGFLIASIPLFWCTARAFDRAHALRDLCFAVALSAATYFVFARLLLIPLPPGLLGRWL